MTAFRASAFAVGLVLGLAALAVAACAQTPAAPQSLYWTDGDSGRLNGEDFRLADVDAPETGGVGSVNGAKCEAERAQGFKAKEWVVGATKGKAVVITRRQDKDRYDRWVFDLSVDGKPLGELGLKAGVYRPWPFVRGKALINKPRWCG